jgi:hypothetical protein
VAHSKFEKPNRVSDELQEDLGANTAEGWHTLYSQMKLQINRDALAN